MFSITKEVWFSAAHYLTLSYDSPCTRMHGHEWRVLVSVRSEVLNVDGMIVDFSLISEAIKDKYDHKLLNDVFEQPTAERLAEKICTDLNEVVFQNGLLRPEFPICFSVHVWESQTSEAVYTLLLEEQ